MFEGRKPLLRLSDVGLGSLLAAAAGPLKDPGRVCVLVTAFQCAF